MARAPEERLLMASHMFDTARAFARASLPPDLPPAEVACRLFLRFYENDFDEPTRSAILARIREKARNSATAI